MVNFLETSFTPELCELDADGIRYEGVKAHEIIFCNGNTGSNYSWFRNLPFAENKGQALIVEIQNLPAGNIFAKGPENASAR